MPGETAHSGLLLQLSVKATDTNLGLVMSICV
jgi:hypothetical protein